VSTIDPFHIPLSQLWQFRTSVKRISVSEYTHLVTCEKCRAVWIACLRNETYTSAEMHLTAGVGQPN